MRYCFLLLPLFGLLSCENDQPAIPAEAPLLHEIHLTDTSGAVTSDTLAMAADDSTLLIFTYTSSWCNGSYPSDEALADLKTPRRLYNTGLCLKNEQGKTYCLVTDKKGRTKALVPDGSYTLHFNKEADYKKSPVNIGCDLYFEPTWGEIKISDLQKEVKFNIELPCDLCDPDIKKRP